MNDKDDILVNKEAIFILHSTKFSTSETMDADQEFLVIDQNAMPSNLTKKINMLSQQKTNTWLVSNYQEE